MRDLTNTPYGKFIWFVGIVEDTFSDPSELGRVRVRAIGFHPSDEILKTENLPLAPVLNGGSARINAGQMVLGFFMDGELLQQPFILGVINGGVSSAMSPFSSNRFEGSTSNLGSKDDALPDTRPVDGSCPQIQKGLCNSAAAWDKYHESKDKKCLMELFKSQIKVNWDPSKSRPPNGGPWCGVFVASILASQGYPYPAGYTLARSFASPKYNTTNKNGYGTTIWEKGTKDSKLDEASIQVGDIAVFNFNNLKDGTGHVGFVCEVPLSGNRVVLLGGNQSNRVSKTTYKKSQLYSVVRAPGMRPETFDPSSIKTEKEGSTR
jgi:uncharacterized protein (TIGR02594 family)